MAGGHTHRLFGEWFIIEVRIVGFTYSPRLIFLSLLHTLGACTTAMGHSFTCDWSRSDHQRIRCGLSHLSLFLVSWSKNLAWRSAFLTIRSYLARQRSSFLAQIHGNCSARLHNLWQEETCGRREGRNDRAASHLVYSFSISYWAWWYDVLRLTGLDMRALALYANFRLLSN